MSGSDLAFKKQNTEYMLCLYRSSLKRLTRRRQREEREEREKKEKEENEKRW